MFDNSIPLVSVFSLVYNHKDFIQRATESFLMQKTNFKFEIVLGEDCSTDGSREVVFDYEKKYPDIIRVITSEQNVGMRQNSVRTRLACRGKYIAFCEGDDYWTDPLKLQKQVDFMEAHPDYSLCFHNAIVLWDDKSKPPKYFCSKDQKETTTTKDVIEKWYIPTASMLMRKDDILELPDWFANVYNGDWALQLILSTKGKIKYIDELMSVYRKNKGGLSGSAFEKTEYINNKQIELLNNFNEYTKGKYANVIKKKIVNVEKETKIFNLKKNHKCLYWLLNPKKAFKKINRF